MSVATENEDDGEEIQLRENSSSGHLNKRNKKIKGKKEFKN